MRYLADLTTPEEVDAQLEKADPGTPVTPANAQYAKFYRYMRSIIPEVSDYIATESGMSFVPYKEDKLMYFQDVRHDEDFDRSRRMIKLPDNLIVVNQVVWDTTTLQATDYRLHPTDEYAGWGMLFNPATALNWNSDFNAKITISGTWCYHLNPSQMYETVSTSITLANDTATSITVADSTLYGVREYVKCESELMQVTDKPTSTTLTVRRGVLGHTAAAHTAQPLQKYTPLPGVQHVATRMCAYLYQKRLDVGGTVQVGDAAFLLDQLPVTVKSFMAMRKKLSFGHI